MPFVVCLPGRWVLPQLLQLRIAGEKGGPLTLFFLPGAEDLTRLGLSHA